jgi:hypothetical protein
MASITKSWKMETHAKNMISAKELMHLMGGSLYIQFVQVPWTGS